MLYFIEVKNICYAILIEYLMRMEYILCLRKKTSSYLHVIETNTIIKHMNQNTVIHLVKHLY